MKLFTDIRNKILRSPRFSLLLPYFLSFIFLSFVLIFFFQAQHNVAQLSRNYFEKAAGLRCEIVASQMKETAGRLDGLRHFFNGSEFVSLHEFQDYTQPFLAESGIVVRTFWIPKVHSSERISFEEQWRKEHGTFLLHDLLPDGRAPVSPEKDVYYPMTLMGPLPAEESHLLGTDMGSDAAMRRIFDDADASPGKLFLFPSPWSFDQPKGGEYLLLSATTPPLKSLPSESAGYVGMIISLPGIVRSGLDVPLSQGLTFELFDISASPEMRLFQDHVPGEKNLWLSRFLYLNSAVFKQAIALADRKFLLVVEASSDFFAQFFFPAHWIFLPLGIFLSALMGIYVWRLGRQRRITEHLVEKKTKELRESEQYLATTLQSVGDALITTDVSGRITRMNFVAEQLTGWKAADAAGRPLKDVFRVINEATREPLIDPVQKVLREGKIVSLANHALLLARDGREIPISDSGSPIMNEEKEMIGVVLVFRDVAEERMAMKSLSDSEKKFRAFFDNMNEGVAMHRMIYGRNGVPVNYMITDVNRRFEEIMGLSREQVIGKLATDAYGTSQPLCLEEFVSCVQSGQPIAFTVFVEQFQKYFFVSAISYGSGIFATVFTDVTSSQATEKALRDSEERLERASAAGKVALWERDLVRGTLSWSNFASSMLGLSSEEFPHTLQAWESRVHPDDLPAIRHLMELHLRDGVPYDTTYRMRTVEGGYVWWHDIGQTQRDEHGRPIRMSGACVDVTERRRAEEELQKLASVVRYSTELVNLSTPEGQMIFLNEAGSRMLGIDPEDIASKTIFDIIPPDLTEKFRKEIFPTLAKAGRWEGDFQYVNLETGVLTDVHTILFYILDSEKKTPLYLANISLDITERKLTEQTLAQEREMLRILIDNIPDSIYVKDISGRKILANRADLDLMGVREEKDVLGKTDADFYPKDLAEQYSKDDQSVLQNGRSVINREEFVDGTVGGLHWLLTSKLPLKGADGQVKGLVGIGRDITDRKHLENKLLTMAHYDTLTSLPNRTLFLEKANTGLAKSRRQGTMCAILFVDLDLFKSVNDALGHSVGDELLKDTALRLAQCVRESDTIARLGGDEFIIFLNDLEDGQFAQQIAERIREKLNSPRIVSGNDLFITASIGIAVSPNDGDTFEELLKNADTAMYAAKEAGRNNFCFFNNVMNQKAVTKMQVERGLRDALLKDELALFYQPVVSVKDGRVRGFEALLRWFRREGGLIFPDEFIPVAEETGLIVPIGEWVLRRACLFNRQLRDAGFPDIVIAVNISVTQLRRSTIVETIKNALAESGMPPESLEIEVTESILIESFEAAVDILTQIKAIGVSISLDDFGTGYSSLSHLQHLPIANLKIDRLFIKNLSEETEATDLTPSIIDLAHKLKLGVVAEGVETDSQLKQLHKNDCDYFQGYFFSRPIPEDKVADFLKEYRP